MLCLLVSILLCFYFVLENGENTDAKKSQVHPPVDTKDSQNVETSSSNSDTEKKNNVIDSNSNDTQTLPEIPNQSSQNLTNTRVGEQTSNENINTEIVGDSVDSVQSENEKVVDGSNSYVIIEKTQDRKISESDEKLEKGPIMSTPKGKNRNRVDSLDEPDFEEDKILGKSRGTGIDEAIFNLYLLVYSYLHVVRDTNIMSSTVTEPTSTGIFVFIKVSFLKI